MSCYDYSVSDCVYKHNCGLFFSCITQGDCVHERCNFDLSLFYVFIFKQSWVLVIVVNNKDGNEVVDK